MILFFANAAGLGVGAGRCTPPPWVTHDETAARFHSAGLTQRFNSLADAQRFADEGLLAQHIYAGLTDRKSQGNGWGRLAVEVGLWSNFMSVKKNGYVLASRR